MRGERAVLVSGRKRAYAALDEPHADSSPSGDSSSTDSSRPPRSRQPTFLELGDGGVSAIYTSRGGPAMPATGGDRGEDLHLRIVATSNSRTPITRHCLRLLLLRSSVIMSAAVILRVAGQQCLPNTGFGNYMFFLLFPGLSRLLGL